MQVLRQISSIRAAAAVAFCVVCKIQTIFDLSTPVERVNGQSESAQKRSKRTNVHATAKN